MCAEDRNLEKRRARLKNGNWLVRCAGTVLGWAHEDATLLEVRTGVCFGWCAGPIGGVRLRRGLEGLLELREL